VNVDYYTDAIRYTQVRVLEIAEEQIIAGPAARAHGDVLVRSQVVGFKKIKFFTNENIGSGKLELPENEMHTTSFWITLGNTQLLQICRSALSDRQSGIFGLLYALDRWRHCCMMCDGATLARQWANGPARRRDQLGGISAPLGKSGRMKEFFEPNLYMYDAYPGGIGFSEPLYRACDVLLPALGK
jgi:DEAD/DEAH box helicase domain-containing protein